MPNTRGYRVPTNDDDPNVPVWNDRLAHDVAADMDDLEAKVEDVEANATRPVANDEIAFSVVDQDGRRTWLETDTAGRPTARAASLISEAAGPSIGSVLGLSEQPTEVTGISFSVVDQDGRRTWLEANEKGHPTQRALDLIGAGVGTGIIPSKYTAGAATPSIVSGPDIVCWGDSMTAGAGGGGITYPGVLATLTGRTVHNRGVGGETSVTITARSGAIPLMLLPSGGVIPASGGVTVTLTPINGSTPAPLIQGSPGGFATGTLAGVPGTLSLASGTYTFTRSSTGDPVTCNRPAPWLTSGAEARRGDIAIIWIGQNGPSVARAIDDARAIITHLTALDKRYLVIPRPTSTDADDALYFAAFGRRALLIRKYLVEYGLEDAGITPTTQDTADMAAGTVPTSLRVDGVHWTAAGYTILGQQAHKRLVELGWI